MKELKDIYNTLFIEYGERNWWPAKTPFEIMVGAILTQNTTWINVEKAITQFGDRLTPEFIEAASIEELAEIIKSSGYYNQKASKLKALTAWFKKYSYDINEVRKVKKERLREELLAVKGIGKETADSILTYALDKPSFVIDTYTKRILYRLGYDIPQSYDELRIEIEKDMPRDLELYNEYHALFVEHAKQHCRKKPICEACPLEAICRQRVID